MDGRHIAIVSLVMLKFTTHTRRHDSPCINTKDILRSDDTIEFMIGHTIVTFV